MYYILLVFYLYSLCNSVRMSHWNKRLLNNKNDFLHVCGVFFTIFRRPLDRRSIRFTAKPCGISTEFSGAITIQFIFAYTVEGDTVMPRVLHSRLCHALLVLCLVNSVNRGYLWWVLNWEHRQWRPIWTEKLTILLFVHAKTCKID